MAIIFKDSSSFKVLCNTEAFCVKKGLLLRNKQSWEFFFFMFYYNLRGYPAEIFMERFFTTLFV